MKKATLLVIAAMLILHTQISAQTTERYITDNLGRIVEVANSGDTLTSPHLLIGYDTTGILGYYSNSLDAYKIFGLSPNQSSLQNLNSRNIFGSPSGDDSYEIRFGSDSSRYWINTSFFGTGGTLAPNRLPFSVYHVGPKSSADTSVTGGTKLCVKVTDQDTNGIFSAGEMIHVFADLALPLDSTYDSLGYRTTNPFNSIRSVITNLRFGAASVPYSQGSFSVPGDGFIPPSGTVIRFCAKTSDSIAPIVYGLTDTFRTYGLGTFTTGFQVISYETPSYSLTDAPAGMTVSNNVITWNVSEDQVGQTYHVTLRVINGSGTTTRTFTTSSVWGAQEIKTEGAGNLIRMWQRNDGSIGHQANQMNSGMEYPINSGYSLNYAGGFYFGGKKPGSGNPDTLNVANVQYQTEFQPGRIMNSGPFGSLIAEDFLVNPTIFKLPGQESVWPADAPRTLSGDPLKLSAVDTWTVFNDLSIHKVQDTTSLSPGFGLEVQRQTFQFNQYPFNHAVLVRMTFINKSDKTYDSSFVAFWNDADVGANAGENKGFSDSSLSLIMISSIDGDVAKTSFGCAILQGPVVTGSATDTARRITIGQEGFATVVKAGKKDIRATSVYCPAKIHDPGNFTHPETDSARMKYMQGFDFDGNTKPGGPFDPGIYASVIADQRSLISSGPFTFAPGDTQEVWYAMIGGMGVTNSSSVDTVRHYASLMHEAFRHSMNDYLVGILDPAIAIPQSVILYPNYPNPFNPSTTIRYELRQASKVTLKIYNLLGQEVRTLINAQKSSGIHSVVWDGKNNQGQRVTSGVYFYRLEAGDFVKTRKMVLVK